jgi:hypothetical protein
LRCDDSCAFLFLAVCLSFYLFCAHSCFLSGLLLDMFHLFFLSSLIDFLCPPLSIHDAGPVESGLGFLTALSCGFVSETHLYSTIDCFFTHAKAIYNIYTITSMSIDAPFCRAALAVLSAAAVASDGCDRSDARVRFVVAVP